MKNKLSVLLIIMLFCSLVSFAADSKGNRKGQTARLGMKSGIHLMYLVSFYVAIRRANFI